MALPGSGTITAAAINTELGRSSTAQFSIAIAANGGYGALNPYSPSLPSSSSNINFASWYNYCHTCTTLYSFTIYIADNKFTSGWSSDIAACSGVRDYPWTVYSSSSTLGVGSTLYYLSSGVYYPFVLYDYDPYLWIYDGTGAKPIKMTNYGSNVVSTVGSCCPEYGTYLGGPFCEASLLDCFPFDSEANMYADGACGVYYVWTGNCCQ